MEQAKKEVLHMKIDAQLKERLRVAAVEDGRTLTSLVEKVLRDFAGGKRGR